MTRLPANAGHLASAQIEYLGSNYNVQSDINPGTTYMDVFPWDVPAASGRPASPSIPVPALAAAP